MIELRRFDNNFEYLEIKNKSASAKIALQGAHLFSFKREKELLWVSKKSKFEQGTAIRGGVPICWPQFGLVKESKLKQHGFARTSMFKLIEQEDRDTLSIVKLKLINSKHKYFDFNCELTITFYIGDKLEMQLKTKNLDSKSITITQALHTYFNVSDISRTSISGLENKPYFDALDSKEKIQKNTIIIDSEVDRVYQKVNSEIKLQDNNNIIKIINTNSASTIVWNPWIDKCKKMVDMQNDGYKYFVCIESANAIDDFITLNTDDTHTLITKII